MSKPDPAPSDPAPDAPVVPASLFQSDCGDKPCPEPVLPTATPEQQAALTDGVRMRENPAEWAFVRLSKLIEDFEKNLDRDEEVGARIVGLPGDGTMSIEDVGFWGPDLIMFLGKNADGKPVRLIQHYAQINVLLDVRKKPEERAARRIGFQLSEMVEKTNPK
ncbi:MAG TPA: DUF6173 family protein [Brevundimonas sp.]|jgi:hypothetical protein